MPRILASRVAHYDAEALSTGLKGSHTDLSMAAQALLCVRIWAPETDACTALCLAQLGTLEICRSAVSKVMLDHLQPRMQVLFSAPTLCSGAL